MVFTVVGVASGRAISLAGIDGGPQLRSLGLGWGGEGGTGDVAHVELLGIAGMLAGSATSLKLAIKGVTPAALYWVILPPSALSAALVTWDFGKIVVRHVFCDCSQRRPQSGCFWGGVGGKRPEAPQGAGARSVARWLLNPFGSGWID